MPELPSSRVVAAGLVGALLVATTAAFVATEALKLKRPPVGQMRGDRVFSPGCGCPQRVARISIRLRAADALDVSIVDADGETVRVLREGARPGRGRVFLRWNGQSEREIVADGPYRLRVRLAESGRTVTFARPIVVDTESPEVRLRAVSPTSVEPGEAVELRFELSERASVSLRVDDRRAGRLGHFRAGTREALWPGTVRGEPLAPGSHVLRLVARDLAGNRSVPSQTLSIVISSPAE